MAELTPQQTAAVQAIAAQVETAYREIVKMRTSLSYLVNAGQATCADVRNYNLLAKSTYFYQRSMADVIRGSGGSPPPVQEPLYIAWKGQAGDAAVDCGQLAGAPPAQTFIDPRAVEWRAGATPQDATMIQQALAGVSFGPDPMAAQLGNPLAVIVPIILVGVIITITGYIVLKIVETLKDVPAKVEHTRQVAISAERHRATLDARAACLSDCTNRGKDPSACAKACEKALPGFRPPSFSGGSGILAWIVGVAAIGGLIWLGYRAMTGQRLLPGVDGADGDEDLGDDALDVDFMERVA